MYFHGPVSSHPQELGISPYVTPNKQKATSPSSPPQHPAKPSSTKAKLLCPVAIPHPAPAQGGSRGGCLPCSAQHRHQQQWEGSSYSVPLPHTPQRAPEMIWQPQPTTPLLTSIPGLRQPLLLPLATPSSREHR